jgi:hypothetical protein
VKGTRLEQEQAGPLLGGNLQNCLLHLQRLLWRGVFLVGFSHRGLVTRGISCFPFGQSFSSVRLKASMQGILFCFDRTPGKGLISPTTVQFETTRKRCHVYCHHCGKKYVNLAYVLKKNIAA